MDATHAEDAPPAALVPSYGGSAGLKSSAGALLEPGDLVFFGASISSVTHVGIYVGVRGGRAILADAPHTGADVRVELFPATAGAPWGAGIYLGATRPSR